LLRADDGRDLQTKEGPMLQKRYCPSCKQYQRTKPNGLVCLACEAREQKPAG
jgi:hypothetical protein